MVEYTDNGDNVEMEEEENAKPLTLSPLRRRPETSCIEGKFRDAAVHLLESRLWFYPDDDNQCRMDDCGDEDDGIVDMSKCSQLVGNASEQLYGCGICILWLLQASQRHPEEDLLELLHRLDHKLNDGGINALVLSLNGIAADANDNSTLLSRLQSSFTAHDLWEDVGFAYRPRVHEVAMALARMRGIRFEILPDKPKDSEGPSEDELNRLEEERKKKALLDLWNNRRR